MAKRVLSIESGRSLIRVLELSGRDKDAKVYHSFSFAAPEHLFDNYETEEFVSILQAELKKRKIRTKKVIFVINSGRIATREIVIPAVKESRIVDLVEANASDYFPVDLSQYVLEHEIIEKFTDEDAKKLRLTLLAIPKDIVDFYTRLAKECGFSLEGMGYTGNASKQLLRREGDKGVRALIKIDGRSSLVTIMEGSKIALQRHINYGIAEAIAAVSESGIYGNPDIVEAIRIMRENNFFPEESGGNGNTYESAESGQLSAENRMKEEVLEQLSLVSGSISRILDYYQSRKQDSKIENIRVIGIGADIKGFVEFLSTEFGMQVERMPLLKGISLGKKCGDAEEYLPTYYSCLGISFKGGSLSTVGRQRTAKKDVVAKKKQKPRGESMAFSIVISSLFVVAAAGMYGFFYLARDKASNENIVLKNHINELAYVEEVINENLSAKADSDWVNKALALTKSENNNLRNFIEELEVKMPSDIRVLSLNSSRESVSLNISVDSKEAVVEAIKQLRGIESVMVGSISTISESTNESGRTTVSFSVELVYTGYVEEVLSENAGSQTAGEGE